LISPQSRKGRKDKLSFYLPPFLSAGLLGGSAAKKNRYPLHALRLGGEN
jgi:hypothetical protein